MVQSLLSLLQSSEIFSILTAVVCPVVQHPITNIRDKYRWNKSAHDLYLMTCETYYYATSCSSASPKVLSCNPDSCILLKEIWSNVTRGNQGNPWTGSNAHTLTQPFTNVKINFVAVNTKCNIYISRHLSTQKGTHVMYISPLTSQESKDKCKMI